MSPLCSFRRAARLQTVVLAVGCAMLFADAGKASANSAYQFLQASPKPNFRSGHTLLPLTRWGWTMSYDTRKELCENWGYALEFGPYADATGVANLNNPSSTTSRICALTASDPQRYPLFVLLHRPFLYTSFTDTLPESTWCHDAAGNLITPKVFSPEMPDSDFALAAQESATPLARILQVCPISVILNGGEDNIEQYGWGDGPIWAQDPVVVAAKGTQSWYDYSSIRKAHGERMITDAVRAQSPDSDAYLYYWTNGTATNRNRHSNYWQYGWDYAQMRVVSTIPNASLYYGLNNTGWTGAIDMLSQALNSDAYSMTFGDRLSYHWLNVGYNDLYGWSDPERYMGFLKCLYTAGMIGGVAGYFTYPDGGFAGDLGSEIPSWLWQMMELGHCHALFSHLEDYLRNGELLPGPNMHRWSTDLPAYEFPTGFADTRVLARRHNERAEWLVCAWAADGVQRNVQVTIPDLGNVDVLARACGSVYRMALTPDGIIQTLIDEDGMLPTSRIEEFSLSLVPGWNLVSLPVEPLSVSTSAVFPSGQALAVWEYRSPGGYSQPSAIGPKRGFWVVSPSSTTLMVSGIRPAEKGVTLKAGWNLTGSVGHSSAQPWQPKPFNPPCLAVWQYDNPGGYVIPPRCDDGRGFWIKASVDTDIWN